MNIKVNMRADIDGFDKKKSTVASGWVEIEGIFKFPVSVRSYHDADKGKDMMFVSYPQRHDGDKYVGVVYPTDRNVRQEIDKAVLDATREKLFAELVPNVQIDDIIHFLRREMLDFTAFPVFFVTNLLLVQRKKYYFNRATVSRNCSIVL